MTARLAGWVVTERDSTVSIRVVRGLLDAIAAAGVERFALLAHAGLDRTWLSNDDARVSRTQVFQMCELALDLTGDPAFGLHWGEHTSDSTFTPLSHLIAHSANFGAGLQTLFDYHRLIADEAACELVQEGEHMTLRLGALRSLPARVRTFVVEMEAVGMCRMMRMFGPEVRPQRVSFAYPAPQHRSEYARIFQGVERFEAPYSCITFSRSLLSAVPPHKDDEVHTALRAIASRRVLRLTNRTPYALRLREQLVKQGPCMRPDMEHAAERLGLSVRSLRRRLKSEGETFHGIVNEAAAIIAKHLLEVGNKSIQEVAFEMGFSDTSGFHRAFKRWTGVTPRIFRDGPGAGDGAQYG